MHEGSGTRHGVRVHRVLGVAHEQYALARIRRRELDPHPSRLFFLHDTATTEIYTSSHTLSLHDALPIWSPPAIGGFPRPQPGSGCRACASASDRKSTRLNSSHVSLSRMPSSA